MTFRKALIEARRLVRETGEPSAVYVALEAERDDAWLPAPLAERALLWATDRLTPIRIIEAR